MKYKLLNMLRRIGKLVIFPIAFIVILFLTVITWLPYWLYTGESIDEYWVDGIFDHPIVAFFDKEITNEKD